MEPGNYPGCPAFKWGLIFGITRKRQVLGWLSCWVSHGPNYVEHMKERTREAPMQNLSCVSCIASTKISIRYPNEELLDEEVKGLIRSDGANDPATHFAFSSGNESPASCDAVMWLTQWCHYVTSSKVMWLICCRVEKRNGVFWLQFSIISFFHSHSQEMILL